jgi:hypothetical protein
MLLSYRRVFVVMLMAAAVSGGCTRSGTKYEGPTVDGFTGRLTHNGKPVSFPEEESAKLSVHCQKFAGPPMNIPIQSDGTFKLSSAMPIGKWSAALIRTKASGGPRRGGAPQRYSIPDGFTIEEGKTEYEIELGPNWKP